MTGSLGAWLRPDSGVGLAIDPNQLGLKVNTQTTHCLFAAGKHPVGEHRAPVPRHETQVCVQQRDTVSDSARGLGCHRWGLQSDHADALPVPHRTDNGSAEDARAGVWVLSGGVQRRIASPRRRLSCWDQAVRQRDTASRHHPCQDDHRAVLALRGTQRGVGAVDKRFPPCLAQLLRLGEREAQGSQGRPAANEISQGSPTVVPAHPERILAPGKWAVVCGQGLRSPGALVSPTAGRTATRVSSSTWPPHRCCR